MATLPTLCCAQIATYPLIRYNANWSPMTGSIRAAFDAQGLSYDPACVVPYCTNVCSIVRIRGGVGIVDEMVARDYVMRDLITGAAEDLPPVSIVAFHRRYRICWPPFCARTEKLTAVNFASCGYKWAASHQLGRPSARKSAMTIGPGVKPPDAALLVSARR